MELDDFLFEDVESFKRKKTKPNKALHKKQEVTETVDKGMRTKQKRSDRRNAKSEIRKYLGY